MEGRGHQAKPNHTKKARRLSLDAMAKGSGDKHRQLKARRLSLDAMAKGSGDKHRQLFFFYNIFYLLKNKIAFKKHKHNKKNTK